MSTRKIGLVAAAKMMAVGLLAGRTEAGAPHDPFMESVDDDSLDCVMWDRPCAGFYQRSSEKDWRSFTAALVGPPNVDWDDPNLRIIDVDGDGFSDILITNWSTLTYYPSFARFGCGAPIRVPEPAGDDEVYYKCTATITACLHRSRKS
jgi:hypothetical protein